VKSERRISLRKIGALTVVTAGLFVFFLWNRQPVQTAAPAPPQPAQTVAPVAETPPTQLEQPASVEPAKEPAVPLAAPVSKTRPASQTRIKPPKEPLHDPDARDALALVGMDPDAEQYWLAAIYDTNLPDNEREDLMEDLNETGFADPRNLTSDDLPLIASRLAIIDSVLPDADDFMAPHLREAQKDLINMLAQAGPH
jgi:hypothetical protein